MINMIIGFILGVLFMLYIRFEDEIADLCVRTFEKLCDFIDRYKYKNK